jgi:DNA polymerase-3 subunit chi
MPRVDRYYLETSPDSDARDRFVCRLIEKAVRQGYRLVVRVRDLAEAETLDQLLWTFRDRSFIPHGPDPNPRAPVWISPVDGHPETYRLLIQIEPELLDPQWERYDRIAEIVPSAQRNAPAVRRREEAYRNAGFDFHEHDSKTAE